MRLLAPLLLFGCPESPDEDPNDPCLPGGDPTLTVGTGELEYVPLSETGGEVELVHGPQGGYHVLVGLQATHIAADDLMAVTMRGTIDGEQLAISTPWIQMRCNGREGALQSWGTFLIYDAQPEDLDGKLTHIVVELTDNEGTQLTAEADATIVDPNL